MSGASSHKARNAFHANDEKAISVLLYYALRAPEEMANTVQAGVISVWIQERRMAAKKPSGARTWIVLFQ